MNRNPDVPPEIEAQIKRAVRVAVTFTAADLFETALALGDVVKLIKPLNREAAILRCAEWNRWNVLVLAHYGTWKKSIQDCKAVLGFIPPRYRPRAETIINDQDFVAPFTEVSLICLIALLCRFGAEGPAKRRLGRTEQWPLMRALFILQGGVFPLGFLEMSPEKQLPYALRTTLANLSLQNRFGYDLGRLHAFLTVKDCSWRLGNETVSDWFAKRLGVDGKDYEVAANVLFGSAFQAADYAEMKKSVPNLFKKLEPLLDLCTTTPEEVVAGLNLRTPQNDPVDLPDVLRFSSRLLVRPLLKVANRHICASAHAMFNKAHRGLPYLCLEARLKPQEDRDIPRIEFGGIFEGYVAWLFRQWLSGPEVRLVTNYWIRSSNGMKAAERDIAVILGETVFLFEVKATVPAMKIRNFGKLEDIVALHEKAAIQVFTAAEAWRVGDAYLDADCKNRLTPMKRVVPCAITFEFLAVRWPYSDFFERDLAAKIQKPIFKDENGIAPFQLFDIEQIEMWDDLFQLPRQAVALLSAIEARSTNTFYRYRSLAENNSIRSDHLENLGIVSQMAEAAQVASKMRLRELEPIPSVVEGK